jgi:hypothetical protein
MRKPNITIMIRKILTKEMDITVHDTLSSRDIHLADLLLEQSQPAIVDQPNEHSKLNRTFALGSDLSFPLATDDFCGLLVLHPTAPGAPTGCSY